jgi:hypothetical protein
MASEFAPRAIAHGGAGVEPADNFRTDPSKSFLLFRTAERRIPALSRLCKFFQGSCLCCLLVTPLQAQEVSHDHAARHHPAQDQLVHEKFYSTWHMPDKPYISCCNNADCYPTEIKYLEGSIYAKRREDGKYILIPPEKIERNRDNPDGRNHLCAPPPIGSGASDTVFCFALGGAT